MISIRFEKVLGRLFYPIIFVVALFLIFEEWLWKKVLIFMTFLSHWSVVRKIEIYFQGLSGYGALAFLAIPWLMLLPLKFVAMRLMLHHHQLSGLGVLLVAKVLGTAIVARVFTLTRTEVLKIEWFKKLYDFIISLLAWARNWLHQSRAYQMAHFKIMQIKKWWSERRPRFFRLYLKRQLRRKKNHFKNNR
jgi:hypothetical protein